jgi:benzodiazapine receptor
MNKNKIRATTNLLAVLATIVVNVLANALPLNGLNTGEISDRFQVFFVPAGYVFSIWGLIYLGLIAFGIYQFLPSQQKNPRLQRVGYLFVFSSLTNIAWLFLWHYEIFTLTLVAMLTLLLLLIVIYLRLGIGRSQVSTREKWFVQVPFSIYLGWITVATIANVTSLLYYLNWNGWGISPEIWTVIMLLVGVVITAAMRITRNEVAYLLVIIWAYMGIFVKHSGNPVVAPSALIGAGLVLLMFLTRPSAFRRVPLSGVNT